MKITTCLWAKHHVWAYEVNIVPCDSPETFLVLDYQTFSA